MTLSKINSKFKWRFVLWYQASGGQTEFNLDFIWSQIISSGQIVIFDNDQKSHFQKNVSSALENQNYAIIYSWVCHFKIKFNVILFIVMCK